MRERKKLINRGDAEKKKKKKNTESSKCCRSINNRVVS